MTLRIVLFPSETIRPSTASARSTIYLGEVGRQQGSISVLEWSGGGTQ